MVVVGVGLELFFMNNIDEKLSRGFFGFDVKNFGWDKSCVLYE